MVEYNQKIPSTKIDEHKQTQYRLHEERLNSLNNCTQQPQVAQIKSTNADFPHKQLPHVKEANVCVAAPSIVSPTAPRRSARHVASKKHHSKPMSPHSFTAMQHQADCHPIPNGLDQHTKDTQTTNPSKHPDFDELDDPLEIMEKLQQNEHAIEAFRKRIQFTSADADTVLDAMAELSTDELRANSCLMTQEDMVTMMAKAADQGKTLQLTDFGKELFKMSSPAFQMTPPRPNLVDEETVRTAKRPPPSPNMTRVSAPDILKDIAKQIDDLNQGIILRPDRSPPVKKIRFQNH